ncbi:hypothetical protein [Pseudogulbenkiania subflava]|uniref:Uncharacterized protein n=1 Tax=Pseudogulbenkiania subflava DSM 22618 TaxID=1123014 RepID=A0A1Y6BJY7_9NEIS|nr:hypothetical protein [Pseudogulbenkiania subflava]SMF14029.1 hypothetical protein SAMN02745746_01531 [Pseudogulbenkiania subflava DSM 22618]
MSQITTMPDQLLNALRELIQQGRQRALRAVDMVHGKYRHIVEFEQGGQLFASKYRLILPSEAELCAELERERAALEQGAEGPKDE